MSEGGEAETVARMMGRKMVVVVKVKVEEKCILGFGGGWIWSCGCVRMVVGKG